MLNRYSEFIIESLLLRLDESVVYYSNDFIETLTRMNTDLSKKLLSISFKDLDTDVNYIDITDTPDQLSFIPDARGESMIQKLTPPDDSGDWKRVELLDPSRVYDYHLTLFKYLNIDEEYLPAPNAHTMGWARLVSLPDNGPVSIRQKFWHFKADLDDPNYILSVERGIESGEPDELRKQDSFYAADEYSSAFKFIDPYKELTKVSKNRNPIKIGRLIKRLLQVANYNASDKEIEEFVNKYKATYATMKDKFRNFKIVSGEEIKYHYSFKNYGGNRKGTLGSSCMRHEKCQDYFKIYTENPNQIRLLVLTDPLTNKTMGRALVWNATCNNTPITFMDRIYTIDDSAVEQFMEYAKENGWSYKQKQHSSELFTMVTPNGVVENPIIDVDIENVEDDWEFPYVDTIKYLNVDRSKMSTNRNSVESIHSDTYKLESQEGTNAYCDTCGGEGSMECDECNGRGTEECDECSGRGKRECPNCDGSGVIYDDDNNEIDCEECGGEGSMECDECDGRGRVSCNNCGGDGHYECPDCS